MSRAARSEHVPIPSAATPAAPAPFQTGARLNPRIAALSLALLLPARAPAAVPADATCTGTLAGAAKAEFACEVRATYDETTVTLVITAQEPIDGVKSLQPLVMTVPAPLGMKIYTLATATEAASQATLATGEAYQAKGARGEVTLAVESIERYATPRKWLNVKGTLTARLAPVGAAKGELHLEIRF